MTNNKTQRELWIIQTKAFLPLLSPRKPSKKKKKARLFFFLIFCSTFFQSFSPQNPRKLTRKTKPSFFFLFFTEAICQPLVVKTKRKKSLLSSLLLFYNPLKPTLDPWIERLLIVIVLEISMAVNRQS